MRVLGVGFGRTATMSLKAALEQLGVGPCFHMIELITGENRERDLAHWTRVANGEQVDWHEVFHGWQATVDWPACSSWRELIEVFPDARVLLNVRDFDGFYESAIHTIRAIWEAGDAGGVAPDASRPVPPPALREVIGKVIWEGDFQGRFADRDWVRQMYERRIQTIKETVRSDRLTVWNIGDGWEPLAAMLGVAVPAQEFPHLHDTDEFRAAFGLPPRA